MRKDMKGMYKKAVTSLMLVNLLFLFSFFCVRGLEENRKAALSMPLDEIKADTAVMADRDRCAVGIVSAASSGQRIVDCSVLEKEYEYQLEQEEWEVLCRIVEAEAGTEDIEGRLLVANVVLNRVADEHFPDTVEEVVFQREKGVAQFSPVSNGRYYQVEISDETREAVERALKGEDISQGALYFAAREYADDGKMKWFDSNLAYLFAHGGHEFYTSP